MWAAMGVLLAVAGSVGAVVAATLESRSNAEASHRAFEASSAQVASSLTVTIAREGDLIASARGFVSGSPLASKAQFAQWASSVGALRRHPEITSLGRAVIVPASELPAFAAAAERSPAGRLPADGVFRVIPPGPRPFYCLPVAGVGRTPGAVQPAGYDFCASAVLRRFALDARDSGGIAYRPIPVAGENWLSVLAPVYRGGRTPSTTAARRAAFLGWVGMLVVPNTVLDRALADHPGTAVTFAYDDGASSVAFHRGAVPAGARTQSIDLRNGWTVRTAAVAPESGLLARGTPRRVLVAGILLSLMLGALVFLLGTGKARALRLVDLTTNELRHQALHDALTGLPNRALVGDRAEQMLARGRRNGVAVAALFVDLDEFKNVNDTLGHEAGDQLLRAVSARLTSGLRGVNTVGRLGGDEFIVLIDGEPPIEPELVAERLLEVMSPPFRLTGSHEPITVSVSIGIAAGLRDTVSELLRDADMALYRAKATGRNHYEVFRPALETALRHEMALGRDLHLALEREQFRLVYQPIYNLDDLSLVSVEALLRWEHPVLGVIQPNDFIPLLEASGKIVDVGRWALTTACRQMASWHARGSTLGIAVNVSARQLDDDIIVSQVREALRLSALNPAALTIEITETVLMRNAEATARRLREIKALGVKLAIDDFGTGYSSLASLQKFPIDTIKIDRAFTDALERSPESDALVRTLVQLGRDLGLTTLAEGVETLAQLDHLRHEDVGEVQGFLLSHPLDAEGIEALILLDGVPRGPLTT